MTTVIIVPCSISSPSETLMLIGFPTSTLASYASWNVIFNLFSIIHSVISELVLSIKFGTTILGPLEITILIVSLGETKEPTSVSLRMT